MKEFGSEKIFFDKMTAVSGCVYACFIPPAIFVCGGYTVFMLSVRVCVRASVCASVRNVLFP